MLFEINSIIGHRGCKLVDHNNTLEAFDKAIGVGADMVEMDVRKTRDDVLVVFHDAAIDGLRLRGALYEEILEAANENGLVVPTLETVLEALEGRVQICVELKESGYEKEVVSLVLKYFSPSEFVITSFVDSVLLRVKKGFPTAKTGLILGVNPANKEFAWRGIKRVSQIISEFLPWYRLRKCGADFIAVNWRKLAFGLLESAYRRGIPVLVWTINDKAMMEKLLSTRKVNGLVTDRADLAIEVRNSLA
jgi:glycerophosphoryl diester phosphodiesterase